MSQSAPNNQPDCGTSSCYSPTLNSALWNIQLSHAPRPGRAPSPPHRPSQAPPIAWSRSRPSPTPSPRLTRPQDPVASLRGRKLALLLHLRLEDATAPPNPNFPAPEAPPLTLCVAQKPEAAVHFCSCASRRPCPLAAQSKSDVNFASVRVLPGSAQPAPSPVRGRWRAWPWGQRPKGSRLGCAHRSTLGHQRPGPPAAAAGTKLTESGTL